MRGKRSRWFPCLSGEEDTPHPPFFGSDRKHRYLSVVRSVSDRKHWGFFEQFRSYVVSDRKDWELEF
jgi:hypothetical protein